MQHRDSEPTMNDDLRAMSDAKVRIVTGPPCSGKTTYVQTKASKRDVIIDYDAIAVALGSPNTHDHPKSLVPYILHVRNALLERVRDKRPTTNVWVIATSPQADELGMADEVILLETDRATCHERADYADRPYAWHALIDTWQAPSVSHHAG